MPDDRTCDGERQQRESARKICRSDGQGRDGTVHSELQPEDDSGFADRVELMPGDYLRSPFGSGYDVALLSGMMHRETPDSCRLLLRKAFDALEAGGLVIVSDVFFDDDLKRTPPFTGYFALNMMLTSAEGSAHAKTEMAAWMRDEGFVDVNTRELPKPNPHTLVIGTKPEATSGATPSNSR